MFCKLSLTRYFLIPSSSMFERHEKTRLALRVPSSHELESVNIIIIIKSEPSGLPGQVLLQQPA